MQGTVPLRGKFAHLSILFLLKFQSPYPKIKKGHTAFQLYIPIFLFSMILSDATGHTSPPISPEILSIPQISSNAVHNSTVCAVFTITPLCEDFRSIFSYIERASREIRTSRPMLQNMEYPFWLQLEK